MTQAIHKNEKINKLTFWLRPKSAWLRFLYITVSGLLSGASMVFPSVPLAILQWVSFIPFALAVVALVDTDGKRKPSRGFFAGFWLVFTQHLVVYHWFFSFHSTLMLSGLDSSAATFVAILAWVGLSFIAALTGGVFGALLYLLGRTNTVGKHRLLLPILAACGYAIVEWGRTLFWFGVPFARLSLGQLNDGIPYTVLTSSIFGSYFLTFLIVLVSFLLGQALYLGKIKARAIVAVSLVCANFGAGLLLANIPSDEQTTVKCVAIQGNISSAEKWNGTSGESILDKYCRLSEDAAEAGAELIVWPETALPYVVDDDSDTYKRLQDFCIEYGVTLIFGCFGEDEDGNKMSLLRTVYPDGSASETAYAKRHLVPFGEYVPMRSIVTALVPMLAEINMLSSDLTPGVDSELMDVEINGCEFSVGGIICFDSIFETLSNDSAKDGADMLCISSNDSWFFDSRAVYMHCEQGRLRAIETGLPVICAANTGISTAITAYGEALDYIDPLVEGYILEDLVIKDTFAIAPYTSNIFIYLSFALGFAVLGAELVSLISKRTKKSKAD